MMADRQTKTPASAVAGWVEQLTAVSTERVPLDTAAGRVLAQAISADRDHPPCDMSAMDGYAIRSADLSKASLPTAQQSARIGQSPVRCETGEAVYIVTGAPLPAGADTVIRVEDVSVESNLMRVKESARITPGANIRRRGENIRRGSVAVEAGIAITPSVIATAAAFGAEELTVYRRVRVGVVVTGDELLSPGDTPADHQIRDSSGHGLRALIGSLAWAECITVERTQDSLELIEQSLRSEVDGCDAVILTGGVSMGERDFVPEAVRRVGAGICFHRLPIRPGKPVLGAVSKDGKPILGLPGNPVSTLVTARRFGLPALRRRAGYASAEPPTPRVEVVGDLPTDATLWHYRQVRLREDGRAVLCASVSSGDITSAGRSDGFVEVPPGQREGKLFCFYAW
jgi:molybdopterin molybdotransferase